MDLFAKILGFAMIGLTLYRGLPDGSSVGGSAVKTIFPDHIDEL